MATLWKFTIFVIILCVSILALWGVAANYSIIFSKTVIGEITGVERIEVPVALVTRSDSNITPKMFSFAVGIRDEKTGEIYTSSTEDRQWAVAKAGQCAEAVYLPYPPWDFEKKGTFHGARLIRLFDCKK
ncbi:hypothetical protein [Bdellovibrio reynosensis]|uniref:Uncharacterized protein n=1 Tax=Bdellovibrio reynosensis TaxID=2835041 RepID=A0ABY4CI27_9BACT|nr:hypothetical protein [Bdellovibrio reynosensis]UOF01870.1 hypothetical protein MNR06_02740 [Bdellovibrio reynosensis]